MKSKRLTSVVNRAITRRLDKVQRLYKEVLSQLFDQFGYQDQRGQENKLGEVLSNVENDICILNDGYKMLRDASGRKVSETM